MGVNILQLLLYIELVRKTTDANFLLLNGQKYVVFL